MKRVKKKVVGLLVLLVSIGSFYLLKQVQKHGKTSQQRNQAEIYQCENSETYNSSF